MRRVPIIYLWIGEKMEEYKLHDCPDHTTCQNEYTIELLRARIAELEAQTRWIPVGERLPEDGQDVAVLDIADHCVDRWRYSPLIADYFSRHYSHWMPLEKWMESIK